MNQRLEEEEQFRDVIFTDECAVQLECHQRKSFRQKNAPRKLKYRHKHPPKIHVWGGFSKKGATCLVMFSGIMNATRYGDILTASFSLSSGSTTHTGTDSTRITTQCRRVATSKLFSPPTGSTGGRAQRSALI